MRALRFPDLKKKVPLSRPQVDRLEAAGDFPKRIQLGPKSVAWVEDEVDEWIAARAARRPEAA